MTRYPAGSQVRAAYLGALLHELCEEIGIRDAGSAGDKRAAESLRRELAPACDSAELQPFSFNRWVLEGAPLLAAGSKRIECWPFYGSPGTAGSVLTGRVRRPKADELPRGSLEARMLAGPDDRPLALLVAGPFGPAVPRYDAALAARGLPVVGVGQAVLAGFDRSAPAVRLAFSTRIAEEAWSSNVVGRVAGSAKGEILIIAHRDTQYCSPGANDNAASLIVMLQLARHFAGRRRKRGLTFLASGAEEIGCLGAREYARRRSEEGTLAEIELCLNFDSLTYGRHPQIFTPNAALGAAIAARYRAADPLSRPRLFRESDTLDGAPFAERGIPAVYLNSRGDNDAKLRLWHRPEDLPGTVDPLLVESSFRAIAGFLADLEEGEI